MTRAEETAKIALDISSMLVGFYGRWKSEKEYEDFAEYQSVVKKKIEETGARFDNMTKRPFRVTFYVQNVRCFVKVTAKDFSWGVMGDNNHK